MGRDYADRLITSSEVVENINADNCQQIPSNEGQARPLTRLKDPELQQEAWEKAVESAPEGKVTGRHVSKVVHKIKENSLHLNKEQLQTSNFFLAGGVRGLGGLVSKSGQGKVCAV